MPQSEYNQSQRMTIITKRRFFLTQRILPKIEGECETENIYAH
jgi:hypothetical protein